MYINKRIIEPEPKFSTSTTASNFDVIDAPRFGQTRAPVVSSRRESFQGCGAAWTPRRRCMRESSGHLGKSRPPNQAARRCHLLQLRASQHPVSLASRDQPPANSPSGTWTPPWSPSCSDSCFDIIRPANRDGTWQRLRRPSEMCVDNGSLSSSGNDTSNPSTNNNTGLM